MMQRYKIVLDSPLGQRYGTLIWKDTADRITGTFSLIGFDNPISGQKDGEHFIFSHNLRTAVSVLKCHTVFEVCEDSLYGTVSSEHNTMKLSGKKVAERLPFEKDRPCTD